MADNLLLESPGGEISIKGGLKRIARDVGLLRPMLQPNGDIDRTYHHPHPHHHTCADTPDHQVYPRHHGNQGGGEKPEPDHTHDWKELSNVLDRLFFWIVFIFMTASAMIILLVPMYKESEVDV